MSYLNQTRDPRRRNAAVVAVIAIHAVIGYGLVTGLTFTKLIETIDNPDGIIIDDVPLPQPTPTEQPEPPDDIVTYVPPPPLPPHTPPKQPELTYDEVKLVENSVEVNRYPTDPGSAVEADPPRPAPSFTPKRPSPRNGNWISNDDYPRRALIDGAEGSAGYRLVVATSGRVSSCELTRSTGNRALDDATCRLISDRARFDPATDESGAKVLGTYLGSVRWQIPE